jgi:proline dehydrogenase
VVTITVKEAFAREREKGAEALLAAMSPDVRKLVEFDARFRLNSVMRQAGEKKAVINTFANMLLVHANERQELESFCPDWGAW